MNKGENDSNANVFQEFNYEVSSKDLVDCLRKGGIIGGVIRELIIDHIIEDVDLSEKNAQDAMREFKNFHKLNSEDGNKYQLFLSKRQLDERLLTQIVNRRKKIEVYKEEKWGAQAKSLYLKKGEKYNKITFKKLESDNLNLMQEAYFSIKDDGEKWETVAERILGDPNQSNSIVYKDISVTTLDEKIYHMLKSSQTGRLSKPFKVKNAYIIVELVKETGIEYNVDAKRQVLNDEFNAFVEQETQKALKKIKYF